MDETDQTPPADAGPRVSNEQVWDVRRLRRSAYDRKVAGVAGGIGRHLDVDPTLIRVLLVVMCFFGGAGFLLYAALWLLVPDEGRDHAAISTGDETQKVLLVVVGVVAALLVLGHGWGGFGAGWPLGLVALGFVVYLVLRDRRREERVATTPYATSAVDAPTRADTGVATGAGTPAPPRAAWAPPPYVPPPPRPRRRGVVLFWPTLGAIAVCLAGLAGLDASGTDVIPSAYPALALGITGLALVVGAFVGRPGGLTFVGVVAALALGLSSVVGGFSDGRQIQATPASAALVRPAYTFENGQLTLDLTQVRDLDQLDGRDVKISGAAGQVVVLVPDDLTVDVDADIDLAGGVSIGTQNDGGGFGPDVSDTLAGTPGSPTLDLDVHLRVGEIDVRQR